MSEHDFIIWLQGYFAALGDEPPTHKNWKTITAKLGVVFVSITPIAPHCPPQYPPTIRPWPVTCGPITASMSVGDTSARNESNQ